jgi:hypothetical protein
MRFDLFIFKEGSSELEQADYLKMFLAKSFAIPGLILFRILYSSRAEPRFPIIKYAIPREKWASARSGLIRSA